MKYGALSVLIYGILSCGCSPKTNIESSMLESVAKWGTWTDVTKSLYQYCDQWDSVLVVAGPTIDYELAEILGEPIQEVLQDGEHGYYFFYESNLRKAITTREHRILWTFEGLDHVSIHKGDTVFVRRVDSWNEAIVRRPTRQ